MPDKFSAPPPLAVLCVGLGAVTTTLIAGVEAIKRSLGRPVGSLTQMEQVGLGKTQTLAEALALTPLSQLVFGAWDIRPDNAFVAATTAKVLDPGLLNALKPTLEAIYPLPGVFDPNWLPAMEATHIKGERGHRAKAEALRRDIRGFLSTHGCERGVLIWCASTEVHHELASCHLDLPAFERALDTDDPALSPTQLYAWAAIKEGLPFVNGSPNSALELPALRTLATKERVPVAGSDFKTGQTMVKTALAPMLRQRLLGVNGWFSTNILGNRDGEVLRHVGALANKARTKIGVLSGILDGNEYPELYGELEHQVHINYYPPRGDAKESWDNVDLFGWLGYPMQIKVDFQCRDSILAAPVALDTVLFLDMAKQQGWSGIQDWLGFYFKAPEICNGRLPVHALADQYRILWKTLTLLMQE
uniref:Myo-inositol-1-phosphate synthase n=1 Tax=Candidatus Kentrum sp. FW TaxID=2126338 RepID=A0A450T5F7_9GAMM|nr:MAG: myo-inositol-1-phosphate synthase [Candidatus Kentron sp. FW]VFJ66450.1 MAG: myo-inositol-1-phosphate synthase [Candidatus Kentron sp. FW]